MSDTTSIGVTAFSSGERNMKSRELNTISTMGSPSRMSQSTRLASRICGIGFGSCRPGGSRLRVILPRWGGMISPTGFAS